MEVEAQVKCPGSLYLGHTQAYGTYLSGYAAHPFCTPWSPGLGGKWDGTLLLHHGFFKD